jgi:hypothetical protein
MGPGIYTQLSQELDKMLFGLIGFANSSKNTLKIGNIRNHFGLQLAVQNSVKNYNLNNKRSKTVKLEQDDKGKTISGVEKYIDVVDSNEKTVYFDAKVTLTKEIDMPAIGRIGSGVYVKVAQNSLTAYYQLAGRASQNSNYAFSNAVLNKEYDRKEFFQPDRLYLSVESLGAEQLTVNTKYETKTPVLVPGMKFFAHLPNDATRTGAVEYEVVSVNKVAEEKTVINVKYNSNEFNMVSALFPEITLEQWESKPQEERERIIKCLPA